MFHLNAEARDSHAAENKAGGNMVFVMKSVTEFSNLERGCEKSGALSGGEAVKSPFDAVLAAKLLFN